MPEILGAIPQQCVQTGSSSETDGSSTARSTDDARSARGATVTTTTTTITESPTTSPRAPSASNVQHLRSPNTRQDQKSRKSIGKGKRSSQKKPLKNNLQPKTAAIKFKSKIPRLVQQKITPSSSTTSLSTVSTTTRSSTQPSTPRPTTGPVRQNSLHHLNFRLRKSISQMDFKQSRRPGNFSIPSTPGRGMPLMLEKNDIQDGNKIITNMCDIISNNKMLLPKEPGMPISSPMKTGNLRKGGLVVTQSHSAMVQKMFHQDDYYYVLQERDPKVAGMRVFATIMLNAWRKRRDEVKRLTCDVADLKRGSIKAKNQLHVFNTLFRVEQKRNNDMSIQLKRTLEDCNQTKSTCESLTTSLISLNADKALLENQLQVKEQDYEGVNTILTQTKSELFKAMTQQRELHANLSMEQRKVQEFENQNADLIHEICDLNNGAMQKEYNIQEQLREKDKKLETAAEEINKLKEQLVKMDEYELKMENFSNAESKYKAEIEALQSQVAALKQNLADTLGCRMKACWQQSLAYQRTTLQLMHWLAYYILPAAPPPKLKVLPFGLTLQKALSIVKR